MPDETEPSKQLILQRVRNRIIEYLEFASSFDDQREYQAAVPVCVPTEIIAQWEDSVQDPNDPQFGPPVFTSDERAAIAAFHHVWGEVAERTPSPMPPLEETLLLPEWKRLHDAAERALVVFNRRGPLSEEREIES